MIFLAEVATAGGGLPWTIAATIAAAMVSAIGVQYWENRKKDAAAAEAREREFQLREKELLSKAEETKAIDRAAQSIEDLATVIRDHSGRITALQTAHETTTKNLIETIAKRSASSQNIPAVRSEGAKP